jgi:predicted thioesterase
VAVGEVVRAEAVVEEEKGKKRIARVVVRRGEEVVMEGVFTCFVLDRHVLQA